MERTKKKCGVLYLRLKHICRNLTVHGPSFLARRDIAFIYKFIYFIIYVQVWIVAVATIVKYYATYQENTIRFTTRTDYLHWNTTFPSITVCEIADTHSFILDESKGGKIIPPVLIKEIIFFNGICSTCAHSFENLSLNVVDIKRKLANYRSDCQNIFYKCQWNSQNMNCCNVFKPVVTEYGICFTINNMQVPGHSLYVTHKFNPDIMTISLSKNCEAFLHSTEDIPFYNMEYDRRISIKNGEKSTMIFSITDIVNEPEVSLMPPYERRCRFPQELPPNFHAFQKYSYSACIIQCRIMTQIELCNCTPHTSPSIYEEIYCDLKGLKCLTEFYSKVTKLKIPGTNETGLNCDCLPSCIESDYNIVVKKVKESRTMQRGGQIIFKLSNKPYERITRQVARTALDLVIAMGNCFGLCFGGSLLSVAEIIYYVCLRRWKH
ncbi:sodium channel protein Nach-like [Battus philenor]|uniref:sodium channel protein Nach-like n=1 Tax=Battus philenor TaxID=42288 RepID=UPI0035D05C14